LTPTIHFFNLKPKIDFHIFPTIPILSRSIPNLKKHYFQFFSVADKAVDSKSNTIVALKQVRIEDDKDNGFPITALREIRLLMSLRHPHIVQLHEIAVGPAKNDVYLVFEYIDHDMAELLDSPMIKSKPFSISEIKCLLGQLLRAVVHLHSNWMIHRDIKMSNLLYSNRGGVLKLADFGLARQFSSTAGHDRMTPRVVTLWYRAPELLLFGTTEYDCAVDMWSCGCVFAELLLGHPLLPGDNELDQVGRMFRLLGTPNDRIWPGYSSRVSGLSANIIVQPYNNLKSLFPDLSPDGFDLLNRMLAYDPKKRISVQEALAHPFFDERPLAKDPELMPTFPELPRRIRTRERQKHDRAPVVNPALDDDAAVLDANIGHVFG
jgi:serine/threonine protein kinase